MFEQEFKKFLQEQKRTATGGRLEQLNKDLTGEKKMIGEVLWPVLQSFEGLTLEYELISTSGVRIYIDAFYEPLGLAFESEGYIAHAEKISRDRFSFEKVRVRTLAAYGYFYVPFSWDELDKKPEACRRSVYELLGRFSSSANVEITIYEREVIRYALYLNRPLRLGDVCNCLQLSPPASRRVLRKLMEKKLVRPVNQEKERYHTYIVEKDAFKCLR
ncbi:hypothetical protein AB6A23_05940 [Paenibacillus tarimensis]